MIKFFISLIIVLTIHQAISAQWSCGTALGKPIHLPKPLYPQNVKFTSEHEIVEVKVEIDKQGLVISAKSVSGKFPFAEVSEKAALSSRFSPTFPKMNAQGIIKYDFPLDNSPIIVSAFLEFTEELKKKAAIECEKIYSLRYKADDSVLRLVDRLIQNQKEPNSEEVGFVVNGKAKVGIRLISFTLKNIEELKSLGVEILGQLKSEKSVIGQIPIEKIETLLESKKVIYVFPFWINSPPKRVI